jgi:bifunctional N-acetylglucosamine-1-phosphate-uridyltransferase/glucosamine-1-phosphate-acetyltransferase GlmU-like protein
MLSLKHTGLKSYEKHILTVLCIHADRITKKCWPSIKCLTSETGLDRKTVQAGLISLNNKNLIQKTGEMQGRTKTTPVYLINLSDPVNGTAQKQSDPVCPTSDPVDGVAKRSRLRDMEGVINKEKKKEEIFSLKTATPAQKSAYHEYIMQIKKDIEIKELPTHAKILNFNDWLKSKLRTKNI